MRDSLVSASNISGNETFTPDTLQPSSVGWRPAKTPEQWAEAQIQRSDLGIEDLEIADEFGVKHIRFNHSGLDAPVVLGISNPRELDVWCTSCH